MNLIVKFTYPNGEATIYTGGNPDVKTNRSKAQVKRSAEKTVRDMIAHLRKRKIPFKMEVTFV